MNILITGIGGPTPRSIVKRLRELDSNFKLIGTDSNPKALGFYMKDFIDRSYLIPRVTHKDYWDKIKSIIKDEKIDIAFVQPEMEVTAWGKYKNQYGKFPCPVFIPPIEHVEVLMNKAKMANLLRETSYIPKTVIITQRDHNSDLIEKTIGFPCWIRASVGSGGLGSLKLNSQNELDAWLFIHKDVSEFTISEYLTGRHLANQMMYINGELVKNAGLHCVEYVMADIAPSKVTGNTSYGRFINEEKLLEFCEEVMDYVQNKTQVKAHGVYSFDLKEDEKLNLKVTEINIRHMAYTGILSKVGFDLIGDTIKFLSGKRHEIESGRHYFNEELIFLRDVDIEPILMKENELFHN